jgi:uncharacterized protein
MSTRLLSFVAFLTMAACSASPEMRYYTLSAEPGATGPSATLPPLRQATYAIDAVIVPDLLDRPQIVLRSGANAVDVLDYDRWAAPLPDQLQRVFTADLRARLGAHAVIDQGLPSALHPDRRITISILEFDPGPESVLEASWEIFDTRSAPIRGSLDTYSARHVASTSQSDVTEIVATMSGLLVMVADDIAVTLAERE